MLRRVYQKLQSVLSAHVKRMQPTSSRLAGKILKSVGEKGNLGDRMERRKSRLAPKICQSHVDKTLR